MSACYFIETWSVFRVMQSLKSSNMIGIEKYTLKDGQTGWQVSFSATKPKLQATEANPVGTVHTRRFSFARYGEEAFQKALEWFENSYYQSAEIKIKSPEAGGFKG